MFIFTQIFIIHKKKFPTSVCLVNSTTNYNFAGLSFQICLLREKLWKTEIVSVSRTVVKHAYCSL